MLSLYVNTCQTLLTLLWEGLIQTVSLSLFRFDRAAARLWVLSQMGAARLDFRAMPEARFWKLCGSGIGEGFTPIPNTAVWAILVVWDDEETARRNVEAAPVFQRWRRNATESWTVFSVPTTSRGAWSRRAPFVASGDPGDGPLAILTRATIRPFALRGFWGHEPAVSQAIGRDPNVLFKIGIGEVPWLHQVTFSIWPNLESMTQFARANGGAHAKAIQAVRDGGWFSEELYARFRVTGTMGQWAGGDPLVKSERSAA